MDPIALAQEVEERYRRYLSTTFYFKDPDLRASFREALDSGHLSNGPYLEATPVFKRGRTPRALFADRSAKQPDFRFFEALQVQGPLYRHQEEAIERTLSGANIVVATGTASGKTETFLYPILRKLYEEFESNRLGPGVRALILYPMNALANDQRERLGAICRSLRGAESPFQFTFGQYIGETPEDERDSLRHARDHLREREEQGHSLVEDGKVIHGELVLRSEIRTSPPHILLTNYSMLEYLLLRPNDSPLFDDGASKWWTFLILDEAHQYRGSRGIEMAMLLRRLKQRLRDGGRTGPFQCIATSATLVGGANDRALVARFASDLFGEEFRKEDVVLAETEVTPESSDVRLSEAEYALLRAGIADKLSVSVSMLSAIANKVGFAISEDADARRVVGGILQRDQRMALLRKLISPRQAGAPEHEDPSGRPVEIGPLADVVFDDIPAGSRVTALAQLVELSIRAKTPGSDVPLLAARYHLLLRSLEGAFISYLPHKRVLLDRSLDDSQSVTFEVALCRECGQHYLVGTFKDGRLVEAIRDPGHPDFGATFFRPVEKTEQGQGGTDYEEDGGEDHQRLRLCLECGSMWKPSRPPTCLHSRVIDVLRQQAAEEKEDQIPRCTACAYQAPDPVREVVHGTDGPHAVIATTLYQRLPEHRKKVLAFADGRQEAAFFAWYLENSYKDILSRSLLFAAVNQLSPHSPQGLSLRDIAASLRDLFRERGVLPSAASDLEVRREAWMRVYREFLTDEPRISLEGVGLIRWFVEWPPWSQPGGMFTTSPWSLSTRESQDLALLLVDSMRTDRAVEVQTDKGLSIGWSDIGLRGSQLRFRIGPPKSQHGVRSWDGRTGKRAHLLSKILLRTSYGLPQGDMLEEALDGLRAFWEGLAKADDLAPSPSDRFLLPIDDARRLNPSWWRSRPTKDDDFLFRCDTCGRLQTLSIRDVCPRHRCPGTLTKVRRADLPAHHYRMLYEEDLPSTLRVEEHTAQLDKEKAREFQRDFRLGRIHVLSCSTTFELGVDLGDLDTVFLRNVPPEAFNYAQRVGRAGRRSGFPGFAITYCRRSPHDLYHFSHPERMLAGRIRPPILSLRNERIIVRHIAALALSSFFRSIPQRFDSVQTLVGGDVAHPIGVTDLTSFLTQHHTRLEGDIRAILPPGAMLQIGLEDGSWIGRITGEESQFALAEAEVASDYRNVNSLEQTSASRGDYDTAKWARARAKTIAEEDVLSFLSRKAVIPKYGFPVDVVELDPQRTQQGLESFEVSLQRDLSIAISEFAPTSRLVANKKLWTSYALKKVAEKEWPRKFYKRCHRHNVFLEWQPGQPEPPTPCGDSLAVSQYVIPRFGFLTDRERPRDPTSRTAKVFTTRPYFAESLTDRPESISMPRHSPLITLRKASPGLMAVICEGRRGEGFYVCVRCGAGFRKREKTHKTPFGEDCGGTLEQVSLAHEFVTDVLHMQFHPGAEEGSEPVWFAFSLASALIEGAAEVLEVPSIDLSATVAHVQHHPLPPIVLYDNVPGGAGLVARLELEHVLRGCLEAATMRVSGGCGCPEATSCYGCLRSYRNQFAHSYLRRGPVARYLRRLLSEWV